MWKRLYHSKSLIPALSVGIVSLSLFAVVREYLNDRQVKTWQTDVKSLLVKINVSQQQYFVSHGTYWHGSATDYDPPSIRKPIVASAHNPDAFAPLDVSVPKDTPYELSLHSEIFCTGTEWIPDSNFITLEYTRLHSDPVFDSTHYEVFARANIDNDPVIDLWVVSEDGSIMHLSDDIKY